MKCFDTRPSQCVLRGSQRHSMVYCPLYKAGLQRTILRACNQIHPFEQIPDFFFFLLFILCTTTFTFSIHFSSSLLLDFFFFFYHVPLWGFLMRSLPNTQSKWLGWNHLFWFNTKAGREPIMFYEHTWQMSRPTINLQSLFWLSLLFSSVLVSVTLGALWAAKSASATTFSS